MRQILHLYGSRFAGIAEDKEEENKPTITRHSIPNGIIVQNEQYQQQIASKMLHDARSRNEDLYLLHDL